MRNPSKANPAPLQWSELLVRSALAAYHRRQPEENPDIYAIRGINIEARQPANRPCPDIMPLQLTFDEAATMTMQLIEVMHCESIHNLRRLVLRATRDTESTLIIDGYARRGDGTIPPFPTMRVIVTRLDIFAPQLVSLYIDHLPVETRLRITREIHEVEWQRSIDGY